MNYSRKLRFAALVLGAVFSLSAYAQVNDDIPAPAKPDLVSMEGRGRKPDKHFPGRSEY
jgi:Spy/CpxP family protein refolding chaperone